MTTTALVPTRTAAELVATDSRGSLVDWFNLYLSLEAGANAANTLAAKTRDLRSFLEFFIAAVGADEADLWTRSITGDFVKRLQHEKRSPTTTNRMLATLRHCARWIHRRRPFLAGDPTERIGDVRVDDPEWKGLTSIEITRLKAAAEHLVYLKRRKNQRPLRDLAIFHVLLRTRVAGIRAIEPRPRPIQRQTLHECAAEGTEGLARRVPGARGTGRAGRIPERRARP
jgi:integrase/recombinase XerD